MSKLLKTVARSSVTTLIAILCLTACKKTIKPSGEDSTTTPRAVVQPNAFKLWGTCTNPYLGSGGVIVPVGSNSCSPNYVGAQQNNGQNANGFSFYGCFKGGTNAPNGANEASVFLCDNITTWTGKEFGFTKTLNDNALKAYLQSPGNVFIYQTLLLNDNGYHNFKAQVQSGDHSKVDFYIDDVYKLTLQNPGQNYYNNYDYFVGTTHRTDGGWSSTGQQIEMYSINVW